MTTHDLWVWENMNKKDAEYKLVLRQARWEAEQHRPMDWQDRIVIGASVVSIVVLFFMLVTV